MHLSLLYRGPGRYALMRRADHIGWLDGNVLRFEPFASAAEAARAGQAGRTALVEWLKTRPVDFLASDGIRIPEAGGSTPTDALDSATIVRVERRPAHAGHVAEATTDVGAHYSVAFTLPRDTYPSVALQPAQRIDDAIREAESRAIAATERAPTTAAAADSAISHDAAAVPARALAGSSA